MRKVEREWGCVCGSRQPWGRSRKKKMLGGGFCEGEEVTAAVVVNVTSDGIAAGCSSHDLPRSDFR